MEKDIESRESAVEISIPHSQLEAWKKLTFGFFLESDRDPPRERADLLRIDHDRKNEQRETLLQSQVEPVNHRVKQVESARLEVLRVRTPDVE